MESYSNLKETTLRDYLRIIFRHKRLIMISFISMLVAVIIGLQLWTPLYQAQVKILISATKQIETPYYRDLLGESGAEITATQSEVIKSNAVMERAVQALGLDQRPGDYEKQFCSALKKPIVDFMIWLTDKINALLNPDFAKASPQQKRAYSFRLAVENLKLNILIEPVVNTNVFIVSATDYSPVGAAIIANTVSRSYIIFDLEQQLSDLQLKYGEKNLACMQMKDSIEKMANSLNGGPLPTIESIGPASVKIIQQASIPLEPMYSTVLLFLIGLGMSILLALIFAFISEYGDQTFKSPRDIEIILNLPFLGSIIKKKRKAKLLIEDTKEKTPYAESLRNLSDQIHMLLKDKKLKAILISSALQAEGHTEIIANLGIYLSREANRKTLILDANLRSPLVYKIFNLEDHPGLADVLEGKTQLSNVIRDMGSNLSVLPAGKTLLNPVTLLDSNIMLETIKQVKEKYEVVLVDCSGLNEFRDGAIIASFLDGVIIVVNEGKSRRQVVKNMIIPLEQKKINLLGVILNNRTYPIPEKIYRMV